MCCNEDCLLDFYPNDKDRYDFFYFLSRWNIGGVEHMFWSESFGCLYKVVWMVQGVLYNIALLLSCTEVW